VALTSTEPHVPVGMQTRTILNETEARELLERLAREIDGASSPDDRLLLVGIRRRGVELADRIAELIGARSGQEVDTGSLDITLYRDDFGQVGPFPVIHSSEIPGEVTDRRVVIVDDVLFTGRTVRAALEELSDFGRAKKVELCVLVDRGDRELPIQADYVGVVVDVPVGHEVSARVPEEDGEFGVDLVPLDAGGGKAS